MTQVRPRKRDRGFTLLEMMLVIAIIGILAAMSIPRYRGYVTRAREAVFQENLYVLRATIERFTLDQKRPPASLQELVSFGYLPQLPKDITGSPATWVVEYLGLTSRHLTCFGSGESR